MKLPIINDIVLIGKTWDPIKSELGRYSRVGEGT